jgi:hypothetical protein
MCLELFFFHNICLLTHCYGKTGHKVINLFYFKICKLFIVSMNYETKESRPSHVQNCAKYN